MCGLNRTVCFFSAWLLLAVPCLAKDFQIVEHHDPINIDPQLSLTEVVELTLTEHPEGKLIPALEQEVEALRRRGDSWLAGAPSASFYYVDDTLGADTGAREIDADLEFPLWNWGQRDAGQEVAEKAQIASDLQAKVIKLRIAGWVREALWSITLESNRHEMAKKAYEVWEKLVNTVRRRVELGDLPKSDLLLAQSELLEKQTELINTEAEKMHSRKHYSSLTLLETIPADYIELQSPVHEITPQHPVLTLMEALVQRKKAEMNWVKSEGSGQTVLALGSKSERESRHDDSVTGMSVAINVPFGGSSHLAPEIAEANLELAEAAAQRDYTYRSLEKAMHEAEHAVKVDRAALKVSKEREKIAREHLKMAKLSFDSGEINLMDLLKIQARTYDAITKSSDNAIKLQRDIALYNQAVGELP